MLAFSYPLSPWLHDHRFAGRTVFPAVESMRVLLAAYAGMQDKSGPRLPLVVSGARFPHLIAVDRAARRLDFQVTAEPEPVPAGGTGLAACPAAATVLTLFWRKPLRAMTRLLRVAELKINGMGTTAGPPPPCPDGTLAADARRIPAERIYRELVPFGPAFHSLQGDLLLSGKEALGRLQALPAPDLPGADWLGTPLPLDGAMHAACVHGQQLADFVPFPVALGRRRICRPLRIGADVQVRTRQTGRTAAALFYDLWLFQNGELAEEIRGLEMRDLSGGAIRPAAWLAGAPGRQDSP